MKLIKYFFFFVAQDGPLDPKQKRKAQNRAAQRAFRDRKEKHVSELQARIEELEKLNATKDEELIKENLRLKEMLQKVQEENYALKGAQFTFEFPLNDSLNSHFQQPTTTTIINDTITSSPINNDILYHTSSSSFSSSGNSFSEDASSSTEQSPLSNSHTHEDDSSASADTPITNSLPFSVDPTQFGLLNTTTHTRTSSSTNNNNNTLDFLAVADTSNLVPNDTLPTGDLFHGKDDLFSNYRAPNNNSVDDFLFANEDLTSLFGATDDLFGFNQTSSGLSFNAQFGLPETPGTRRLIPQDKKQIMLSKLKQAQQEGKYVYQGYQDMRTTYPDFNLDVLCDELKEKAKCSLSTYPITDREVNAFMKCLEKN